LVNLALARITNTESVLRYPGSRSEAANSPFLVARHLFNASLTLARKTTLIELAHREANQIRVSESSEKGRISRGSCEEKESGSSTPESVQQQITCTQKEPGQNPNPASFILTNIDYRQNSLLD
jgi:hypothetical protein